MKNLYRFTALVCVFVMLVSALACGVSPQTTPTEPKATKSPETQVTEEVTSLPSETHQTDEPETMLPTSQPTKTPVLPVTPTPTEKLPTEHAASSFSELFELSKSGVVKDGDVIRITCDMEITEPIKFYRILKVYVEGSVTCHYPIETECYRNGECLVKVKEGVDVSGLDLRFDTPGCILTWEGQSPYQSEEAVAEVMNVKSYNGVDLRSKYKMGGISWKRLVAVTMRVEDNPGLESPFEWTVDGNVAYLALSYKTNLSPLKTALLTLEMSDGSYQNVMLDLTSGPQIMVTKDCTGDERGYKIITEVTEYNLPVVYINIEDGKEVDSKEEYLSATVRISTQNAAYGDFPELEESPALIRGRGHFTWNFDKTPYKLRFETKTSVLGMNASKNWVLLANYLDRSLIQNHVAMEMGKVMDNLPYHSNQYPVDLFVNGKYRGVYTLGEQLEGKEERIGLEESYTEADTDYLLELGGSDDGDVLGRDYFHAGTLKFVAIKHPDSSQLTKEQLDYLTSYVKKADNAVRNLSGYEDYIDVDSLIDWVIIHELTYNLDCCFRRSCYMIKEKGGKLKMGPIWDFDLAFGSYYRYYYGDWATIGENGGYVGITWMNYLVKDDAFMEKLKARWNEVKDELLKTAISTVDGMSKLVAPSAEENFRVWDILGKELLSQPSSHTKYDTYEKMTARLRAFITDRYNWLDDQLNK